jgi:hypothetical protein
MGGKYRKQGYSFFVTVYGIGTLPDVDPLLWRAQDSDKMRRDSWVTDAQ